MRTSVTDGSMDTSELESMKAEAQAQIDALTSEILALQQRNAELLRQISEASIEEAAVLRQEYNANKDRIEELQAQLRAAQEKLKDIETALEDAYRGDDVATDDYHRIPAIMAELQAAFGLVWQGEGSWSGYTFTRKATMSSLRGNVTFRAKLSIARKPKYFLGIKILRAIVRIDWSLEAEYSDTHVAAVVKLDPSVFFFYYKFFFYFLFFLFSFFFRLCKCIISIIIKYIFIKIYMFIVILSINLHEPFTKTISHND